VRTFISALCLSLALTLPQIGCGSSEPEPEQLSDENPPIETQAPVEEDQPEVIDQAAGRPVDPLANSIDDPAAGDEDTSDDPVEEEPPTQSPLAGLPGISPTQPVAAEGVQGSDADAPLQVLVQVTVYELSPASPVDLAPLEQYLASSGGDTLAPAAVDAMSPLVSMLTGNGVLRVVSAPRVLVASGKQATVEVMSLGTGQTAGLPTARESLRISLAPTATPPGENSAVSVTLGYDLVLAEADSAFEVLAQDLGLAVGASARAGGTATLPDQHSHFFVRRVVGDGTDRELLVLIRPQVIEADLTK